MLFTASSVRDSKKTVTGVRRLSISVVRERICFTRRRISAITDGVHGLVSAKGLLVLESFHLYHANGYHNICPDPSYGEPFWHVISMHI